MKRISQARAKLLLTVAYGCVLLVFWYFGLPCVFLRLLGVPCPGCGMSRAVFAALRLELSAAFAYHPMFWSMPLLYLYFLYDGRLLGRRWLDKAVLWSIAGGFFLQWIWKLLNVENVSFLLTDILAYVIFSVGIA